MITCHNLCEELEQWAPLEFQAAYDNSGLIVGDPGMEVHGVMVALDVTEEVILEAVSKGCNFVLTHHPIIFKGLKQLIGKTEVERCVILALRHNVALYAAHTNLDSIHGGVSHALAEALTVKNLSILAPREDLLFTLSVFTPLESTDAVAEALFSAGAGRVGQYDECHFSLDGKGTFRPLKGSNPALGKQGERSVVLEQWQHFVVSQERRGAVQTAMELSHPYEVVAHTWTSMENSRSDVGFAVVGDLEQAMCWDDFIKHVKSVLGLTALRHSPKVHDEVKRIALCGGAGVDLLPLAIRSGAQAFITADISYHRYFEAKGALVMMDVGHWESEQFTIQLLADYIRRKFPNFAILTTTSLTNPMITV
ncbi:MAG: Nif3-like dinuclear metal center hexameric protein [Schleiferiaceae bacterium]|nr:Nif3-like dinuclear metal center hexameric protein [Schleiferiaceae bacterium]